MPRVKNPSKPKRNVWKDENPYGYYTGNPGTPDEWAWAFGHAMGRPEAEEILGNDSAWSILGLKAGATQAEIKTAFRKMAMLWHPDKNKGNEKQAAEQFKKIRAAYEVLKGS